MIRFLHCADIHLDAPFALETAEKSAERREGQRALLAGIFGYVKEKQIPVLLFSGDIFDSVSASPKTVGLLARLAESVPDTRIFIAPGNHDRYIPGGVWDSPLFPQNVHVFRKSEPEKVTLEELGVDVWGYGFVSAGMESAPFGGCAEKLNQENISILCAHGDIYNPLSTYCPISKKDMRDSGFDYIALGHIHAGTSAERLDNSLGGSTYFAYPGCPEGRSFDECGIKGCIVVTAEKQNGKCKMSFDYVRFGRVRYEKARLDLSGTVDSSAACEAALALMKSVSWGKDTLLSLTLEGTVPTDGSVNAASVRAVLEPLLDYIEITDMLVPAPSGEELEADMSIRGEFYRTLLPKIENGDEKTRKTAIAALKMGLAAFQK